MNWYNMVKISQHFEWIFPNEYSPDEYQAIVVNIDKFDNEWKNDPYYVSRGGNKIVNPIKYEVWKARYQQKGFVAKMPVVKIGDAGIGKPVMGFIDGRHRYSVYRDNGEKTIPIIVPKDQIKQFQKFV